MVKNEKVSAEETVRHIRRETRRKYNAEEKIRIVLEGLRGEASIAELVLPRVSCYGIMADGAHATGGDRTWPGHTFGA